MFLWKSVWLFSLSKVSSREHCLELLVVRDLRAEIGLAARGREREIENSKSFGIVHRKARKTTFQRRDKYFFCMYCINNDLKFTFAYMFSEISDL